MRWVLERGQSQESGDGRRWLDGAIFDITVRRAAEQALREKEVVEAQLAEVRASRARILDAADRARHEIERNLHDGAQQRFVSVALELQRWLAPQRELSDHARGELDGVLTELRTGLAELRDLARGLHPAILTDRGLERALTTLADHATVPVELRVALPNRHSPCRWRPPRTSRSARRSRTSPSTRVRLTPGSTSSRSTAISASK